jgi:methyl-accepting chemotaxis protein
MGSFFRRYSIKSRLIAMLAGVIAAVLLVGGAGVLGLTSINETNQQFRDIDFAWKKRMIDITDSVGKLRRYEKDLIINMNSIEAAKSYNAKWNTELTEARKELADAITHASEIGAGQQLTIVQTKLEEYAARFVRVAQQVEAGAFDNPSAATRVMNPAREAFHALEKSLNEIDKALDEHANQGIEKSDRAYKQSMLGLMAFSILAMVTFSIAFISFIRSTTGPIRALVEHADAIAKGDLVRHIDTVGKDELAALSHAMSMMAQSLAKVVSDVRDSSESIATASSEIAQGNADLSSRTESQAGSLQQTASSVEQLTSTVKQNADAARQANQLATAASSDATRGGEVVRKVVTTMTDIHSSSKKIAEIISVIDGIAFQTNILALNAAVEAARAGEQGRGFAVVAGEVRTLAQRSADAAKEIKALIGDSVDKVATGTSLVSEAGQSMTEIVASVKRVTDIIGEITAATVEQSSGIEQVNTAVGQLDQMTQQNAALVEESAAAASSLKDQAARLNQTVRQFSLA